MENQDYENDKQKRQTLLLAFLPIRIDFPNPFLTPLWIYKPAFVCKKGKKIEAILKKYDLAAYKLGKMLHDDKWFDLVLREI